VCRHLTVQRYVTPEEFADWQVGQGGCAVHDYLARLALVSRPSLTLTHRERPVCPIPTHATIHVPAQREAEGMGFKYVAAGPLVRSSYKAGEFFLKNMLDQSHADAAKQHQQKHQQQQQAV